MILRELSRVQGLDVTARSSGKKAPARSFPGFHFPKQAHAHRVDNDSDDDDDGGGGGDDDCLIGFDLM